MKLDGVHVGETVRFRYRGDWEYAVLVAEEGYSPVDWSLVEPGTVVHQCVWKGDVLVRRRTLTMPDGGEERRLRLAEVEIARARYKKMFGLGGSP